ncbi:putative Exo-beta-1,3-glucanase [Eremomyces bilateralis CBS 781.70]|uniref:glucan 1,3-beta-glucosidase n=1 Tax=Eremomyces bilateralis CBS 781.70 TaxID=1392243 RepID=A0A6G1FQX5_9PEZI|nr:putative Exo-beta-1,3-glucanase [Eremomyces bilateralis CBS 781.70]KAF1808187.1 putative Exo-beta-1,3-glucanase [Eremomyces bilateralis CBS 781.70]
MVLLRRFAALVAAGTAIAGPIEKRAPFNWGSEKIRGLNIGGWLVLEPWITPSVFRNVDQSLGIVDEYTLCERLPDQAASILRQHWDTWVGPGDIARIASAGFNMIRIPIGYWAFDNSNSPYVQGAADYLDSAIDWARAVGLPVMIDLHGLPGSQNGFDNSGQRMASDQITFLDGGVWGQTSAQALHVLSLIAQKYAKPEYSDVVMGIELANEPVNWQINIEDLRQFYREGYGRVREQGEPPVVISDAFLAPNTWNGFLTPSDNDARNVAVDHHEYQVFDNYLVGIEPWEHRQQVCNTADSYNGADKWTFVGEWTAAMTDCAPFLNGYGIGARYDGTYAGGPEPAPGSCEGKSEVSAWTEDYKDDTRGYIEAQMDAYEAKTEGWVFWNFKTEGAHEWDAFRLMDAGVFPVPVTDRKFGPVCGNL